MNPRERHTTAGDGVRLFVRDWGDPASAAIPLLCLPGLTRNGKDFEPLARRQASSRRVLCPDLRGRGRSAYAPDWRSYEPRTYVDDLRHILAALGLGRVVVIGTSMGGLLGMAFMAAMPTVLAGLVLNDVGPEIGKQGGERILAYIAADRPQPDWPSAVAELRQRLPKLSLKTDEDWLTFAKATFKEGADSRLHFDWDTRLAWPILRRTGVEPDLWPLWRALRRTPVLAIRGAESDVLSAATFARMKSEKPNLVQLTLPAIGHAPTLDEPLAREAIDDFLHRL
ncbi:MAG: alpha/beta fold hydrolase [Pseudomonadota bacterium]